MRSARAADSPHIEDTIVPVAGADTDIGVVGGYIASIARVEPALEPYAWRLESGGVLSVKRDHPVSNPYSDVYAALDLPYAVPHRLRLRVRLSYTRERTLKYYGLGNASRIAPGESPTDPRFEYDRTHPTFSLQAERRVASVILLTWGLSYTHNVVHIPNDGLLAHDLPALESPATRLHRATPTHAVAAFSYGVSWDDRDDEVSASRGQYHTLQVDLSPGGARGVPYRFARADLVLRGYLPLWPGRVTLAARALSDLLFGDAPFYELARYEDTYAVGGSKGVRGVPAQRYQGKVKLIGNLELRSELVHFRISRSRQSVGIAVFVDSGRVWAGYRYNPELDGNGLGLKVGLGGGLRWRAGKSFVLRGDVAWSPDARPIGAYLLAGQMF